MPQTLYANQQLQPLDQHSALVGLLSEELLKKVYPGAPFIWSKLAKWAGFLHDIGKMDPTFQQFVKKLEPSEDGVHLVDLDNKKENKKFSWSEYPRHNEVSWLLMTTWFSKERARAWVLDTANFDAIRYSVYWHHAKPLRDEESSVRFSTSQKMADISEMHWLTTTDTGDVLKNLILSICRLAGEPTSAPLLDMYLEQNENVPAFKHSYATVDSIDITQIHSFFNNECMRSAIRACVVGADRIVSRLSALELQQALECYQELRSYPKNYISVEEKPSGWEALLREIEAMRDKFELSPENSLRNNQQNVASSALSKYPLSVLQGPAGCGKTKVILQTIAKNPARKTFILVPRVAIGQGLFNEFINDYGVTQGVELYTGDLKKSYDPTTKKIITTPDTKQLQGTLVITTIDQLCSLSLSHERINLFTEVMSSNVIFDEFHELFDIPGIVLLFLEFMRLRAYTSKQDEYADSVRTVLVSATINPYFLKQLEALELLRNLPALTMRVHSMETDNTKPYTLTRATYSVDESHPFTHGVALGEIAVSNTVRVAQNSAVASIGRNMSTLCFHSKYTPKHKQLVHDRVMAQFGKKAIAEPCVLFAGPIVQASLNISTRKLHTEVPTAENFLQRLGRVNRFKTFDSGEIVLYDVIKNGKSQLVDSSTLNSLYQTKRAQAWLDYCVSNNLYKPFVLNDMYAAYSHFHAQPDTVTAYTSDYQNILKASLTLFKKMVFDPIQFPKTTDKAKTKSLSKNSLRGRSYYILPQFYQIIDGRVATNTWLYNSTDLPENMLTNDLNYLNFVDDTTLGVFLEYMRSSAPSVIQHRKLLPQELQDLFNARKKHVKFQLWKQRARHPSYPVVLTHEGSTTRSEYEQVYLQINNTWIGLAPLSLSPSINGSTTNKEEK